MKNLNYIIESLKQQYTYDEFIKIIDGLSLNKKTTFRINTLLSNSKEVETVLLANDIKYQIYNKIQNIYFLEECNVVKIDKLDLYKNGKIYLQNLSSMLPSYCLNAKQNQEILDMCSAPGGKTSLICALTENKSHIMACELNKQRYERLKYNLNKLGCKNVNIVQINSNQLDDFYKFDRILLDAPCSGSGTINLKDINTYSHFSSELVKKCINSQKSLLNKAIKLLKKGETMIYSTCSLLKQENEDIIKPYIKDNIVITEKIDFIENSLKQQLLSSTLSNVYTIRPDSLFEGFFIAKLKKL